MLQFPVVIQVVDELAEGLDVFQLGLFAVPEFIGFGYGVRSVFVVAPCGGNQVRDEVGVDGLDLEAVLVLDAVVLAVVGVVGDGILILAGAVQQGDLNAVVFGYGCEGLRPVGALEDECAFLALGREGDIAVGRGGPVDGAVVVVHLGVLGIGLAGGFDGLGQGFDVAVALELLLGVGVCLAAAGDAGESVAPGDAGEALAVGVGQDAGVLDGVAVATGDGAAGVGAAGGESEDHGDGKEQRDETGLASRSLHSYHLSFP